MAEDDWHSDDDDDKGSLGKDVVNTLHFGGGMIEKKGPNIYGPGGDGHDGGENKAPKNRLDALQEIVAKSKMFKLQKKEAKEEQENDREKLDKDFQDLVSGSMLDFQPKRRDRSEDKSDSDVIDEYDVSLRAMAFEVKARPSDRTKSDEEKAVEARTRLEELEAARIRRMNNVIDPGDANDAEKALNYSGGNKRRKRVTDDEVDGSFGSSYPENDDENDDDDEEENDDDEEEDEDDEEDEENEEEEDEENEEEEGEGEGEEGDDEEEEEDDWEEEIAEEGAPQIETLVKKKKKKMKSKTSVEVDDEEYDEDFDDSDEEVEKEVENKEEEEDVEEVPERIVKKLKKADKAVEQLASEGTYVPILIHYSTLITSSREFLFSSQDKTCRIEAIRSRQESCLKLQCYIISFLCISYISLHHSELLLMYHHRGSFLIVVNEYPCIPPLQCFIISTADHFNHFNDIIPTYFQDVSDSFSTRVTSSLSIVL